MLVILNLPLIGMWIKLLTVPNRYLYPSILVFNGDRRLQPVEQRFRRADHGGVRDPLLHLREARVRARADDPRLHSRPLMEENLRPPMLLSRGDPFVFVSPSRPISSLPDRLPRSCW